ncbi:MAG TPA: glycosyltransferase family 4 protein [Terriglobales bacterium]|nr:glycosyltransferase family 4 protein [Terriglobales bacterium]
MSCRLVVITEIIAPYRIPVFNALAQKPGIDLHVIFLAETDPTQRQWLVHKEEIRFSFEVLPSWRRRIHRRNLLLNWGVDSALRLASPDAVVCGGYNYLASWEALRWARRNRVPFLLWVESTVRDLRSGSLVLESLKRRFLQQCDGFTVAGKSSFEYLNSYGVPEHTIFTAPNAVDTDFFKQAAEQARRNESENRRSLHLPKRYFLFVGRLVKEKGIFDLLEAYAMLAPELRKQISLLFAGDGIARTELERRAAAIQPGSIQVAGFLQREALAVFYALAEAFVFPTHSDPWGLVVNEAMVCGLPVICSSAAGCAADLVDRQNGRVVCASAVGELASALNELAIDPQLRAFMNRASMEKIQGYSPEACAAGMARAALSCAELQHA